MAARRLDHSDAQAIGHSISAGNAPQNWWDVAYEGSPPWDIGHPQDEFARLADSGEIHGCVLDVGCGTGENALYFAKLGREVWGVDISSIAINRARGKAAMRGLHAHFMTCNVLNLSSLGRSFHTITDCGLFHTLDDDERPVYERSLRSVLEPEGTYFMLAMSDKEPTYWGGPRRVAQSEISKTFRNGWKINYIREARFGANLDKDTPLAWLSSITKE